MKLDLPSARQQILGADGMLASPFYQFWAAVRRTLLGQGDPVPLPSYTVLTLPDPALNARGLIFVADGAGGLRLAVSTGSAWTWADGTVVS